jgi:hypothetical protein
MAFLLADFQGDAIYVDTNVLVAAMNLSRLW